MSVSVCQSNECIWAKEELLQGVIEGMTCCVNVIRVFNRVWIVCSGNKHSRIGNDVWIWWHFCCSLDSRVFLNNGFSGSVCSAQSVQCAVALWVKPDIMKVVSWVSSISSTVPTCQFHPYSGSGERSSSDMPSIVGFLTSTLVIVWIHSQGGVFSRTWVGPWGNLSFQWLHLLWVHQPCHSVRSLGVLVPSGFVSLLCFLIWL